MKYLFLSSLLFVVGCATSPSKNTEVVGETTPVPETPSKQIETLPRYVSKVSTYKAQIDDIIAQAECILKDSTFHEEILAVGQYTLTEDSPTVIVEKIKASTAQAEVKTYSKTFTSAVAYREGNSIYINSPKFNKRPSKDWVGTLVHEYLHLVGYNHSFWVSKIDLDSPTYKIGSLVGTTKSNCLTK